MHKNLNNYSSFSYVLYDRLCVHYVKYSKFFAYAWIFFFVKSDTFFICRTSVCSCESKSGTVHIHMLLPIISKAIVPACITHFVFSFNTLYGLVTERQKKVAYCIYTFLHRPTRHLKCYRQTLIGDLH